MVEWHRLTALPRLLLQHDENPIIGKEEDQLLQAWEAGRVHAALGRTAHGSYFVVVGLGQRLFSSGVELEGKEPHYAAVLGSAKGDSDEHVTSLSVLHHSEKGIPSCTVLLGTSSGAIQLHLEDGTRVLRHQLHNGPVEDIHIWYGNASSPSMATVTLAFKDAIVLLPLEDLVSAVRSHWHSHEVSGLLHLPIKWALGRDPGPRCAAGCFPAKPPGIYEELMQLSGMQAPRKEMRLDVLTAGSNPPIAAFSAAFDGFQEVAREGRAGAAVSWILSHVPKAPRFARFAPTSAHSDSSEDSKCQPGSKPLNQSYIWDDKRTIERLCFSPCGNWAVSCDSVGRVGLIETRQPLLVVFLKGYRAAQAVWAQAPNGRLVIIIYAPRRGRLEAWTPDLRTRLAAVSGMSSHGLLLALGQTAHNEVWFLDLRSLQCVDGASLLWPA